MATYYEILGVEVNASGESIKRAYRDKAKKLHPDINSGVAAKSSFQQINEAYTVLSNEKTRHNYDLRLRFGKPPVRVYYHNGHTPYYRPSQGFSYYHKSKQEEESLGLFERILDNVLYLFMLGAGLFAFLFGITRLWAEPIDGVNPVLGIVFGALLTTLLVWGWHTRKKSKR